MIRSIMLLLIISLYFEISVLDTVNEFKNKSENIEYEIINEELLDDNNHPKAQQSATETITEIIFGNDTIESDNDAVSNVSKGETVTIAYGTNIENVTEIDANNEEITETVNSTLSNPIETSTKKTKTKKKKAPKKQRQKKTKNKLEYCHCDVTKNACDVNCCCDEECSEEDRTIFEECLLEPLIWHSSNLKYCNSDEIYKNKSPWLIDILSNSLFCVLKDHSPPKLYKNPYKPITTNDAINAIAKQQYSWSIFDNETLNSILDLKPYHYGSQIWIIVNSTIKPFELPNSELNMLCSGKDQIKYLINHKSYCITQKNDVKTNDLFYEYNNTYLISSPKLFNDSWLLQIQDCPKNICIPFESFVCNEYKCEMVNSTENYKYVYNSVKYNLISNGSIGFINAKVYFEYSEIINNDEYVEQYFEVVHSWTPYNNSIKEKDLSGNPGYIINKPIIKSEIIQAIDKNTSISYSILDYFSDEYNYELKNVFFIPEVRNGYCILSNITNNKVKFNENIQSRCKIVYLLNKKINSDLNATNVCVDLQRYISHFISDDSYSENKTVKYVSMYGNPSQDLNDWIEFITIAPQIVTKGKFDEFNKKITCENIYKDVYYEFVYAHVTQTDSRRNVHLLGGSLRYSIENEVSFDIIDNKKIMVNLQSSVRFYDITTSEREEYAKGPHLHITLPVDFFYPFTYSNCISINNRFNILYFIVVTFTVIFINVL